MTKNNTKEHASWQNSFSPSFSPSLFEIIIGKKQECFRPFMWSELFHLAAARAPSNIPRLFQPAPNAKLSTKLYMIMNMRGINTCDAPSDGHPSCPTLSFLLSCLTGLCFELIAFSAQCPHICRFFSPMSSIFADFSKVWMSFDHEIMP